MILRNSGLAHKGLFHILLRIKVLENRNSSVDITEGSLRLIMAEESGNDGGKAVEIQ